VMSSADVKYTLDTVFSSDFAKSASFYEGSGADKRSLIKSVEAPDAKTVVVTLTKPWVGLLSNLVPVAIIPKDSYESQKTHPLGTGPFVFGNYDNAQQVVDLTAFPDYWEGPAKLQSVRVRVISDMNALQAELQAGGVDIAPLPTSLSPDAAKQLGQHPNLKVLQFNGSNVNLLTINTSSSPLDNVKVRQAIAYAIDREKIIKHLWRGQAKPATGVIPPSNWSYAGDVETYPYNPQRARELLREAGQENLSFTYRTATDDTGRLMAAVLQQQLREVGIQMDIRSNEFATFYSDVVKGNFQMYSLRWIGGNNDPDILNFVFHSMMYPPNGANRGRYANPEVDRLIDFARREVDTEKRRAAYQSIQRIVAQDVPYVSLFYVDNVAVYNKRIAGMKLYPAGEYEFLADVSIRN